VKQLKRKYNVKVFSEVYCSSSGYYVASCLITGGGKRDKRDIDLAGCRIMWHSQPFTYQGYPAYVTRSIADQLKQMSDEGELSVYEYNRDGDRRYQELRYHVPEHLEYAIDYNFKKYGSGKCETN